MDLALPDQIQQCAPGMDVPLMTALIRRESNFNPYAIGMDGKATLTPQPRNMDQAITAAEKLIAQGKSFSVGLTQLHISNVETFGLKWWQAFDGCTSLHYAQQVYQNFYAKAIKAGFKDSDATFAALRGYNSGDIYAQVSNDYAARIMSSAAGNNSWQARPISLAMIATSTRQSAASSSENESLEMFDK